MKRLHSLLMILLAGLAVIALSPNEALAKRLGGGKSFGGRPTYSEPYRPAPESVPNYRAPQPAYQASQRNQTMRESFRTRGGLMGMLGGLALGGFLGSMLFGGAFEHINLFDLLVLGLVAYLLYRMLSARRRRREWEPAPAGALRSPRPARDPHGGMGDPGGAAPVAGARFDTDLLFGGGRQHRLPVGATAPGPMPADFDAASFLSGAKNAFRHLQAAWDEGDLSELRALTTQPVFDELRQQLQQRSGVNRTEVLALEATVLDVRQAGSATQASVLFEGMLRETAEAGPREVREVWHFVRETQSRQPTWFLDGIQQVEN